jgi:Trk-type K+ transport system membrane component
LPSSNFSTAPFTIHSYYKPSHSNIHNVSTVTISGDFNLCHITLHISIPH